MAAGFMIVGLSVVASAVVTPSRPPQVPGDSLFDSAAGVAVTLTPAEIRAGMFYAGATLRVEARVPAGLEVAVVCVGNEERLDLKRKGKVLGLIWMNVADESFRRVPDVYLLSTSISLQKLASAKVRARLHVGFDALRERAAVEGDTSEARALFGELVRLKERDGLYGLSEASVELHPAAEDSALAVTELRLPPKAEPGEYRILVYGFDAEHGVLLGSGRVRLAQSGVAAFITSMATRHGLLYGVGAVLVAVAVGLLTGALFGLGSGKAH